MKCRHKPDIRALEDANYALATSEKYRLENKQRAVAKVNKEEGTPWIPRWFDRVSGSGVDEIVKDSGLTPTRWTFNSKYWEARTNKDWSCCPDIYSNDDGARTSLPRESI